MKFLRRRASRTRLCVRTHKIRKWFVWFKIPMFIGYTDFTRTLWMNWWKKRAVFLNFLLPSSCWCGYYCKLDRFDMNLGICVIYHSQREVRCRTDTLAHVHLWLYCGRFRFYYVHWQIGFVLFVFIFCIRFGGFLVLFWFVKIFGEQSIRQILIRLKCLLFRLYLTKKWNETNYRWLRVEISTNERGRRQRHYVREYTKHN